MGSLHFLTSHLVIVFFKIYWNISMYTKESRAIHMYCSVCVWKIKPILISLPLGFKKRTLAGLWRHCVSHPSQMPSPPQRSGWTTVMQCWFIFPLCIAVPHKRLCLNNVLGEFVFLISFPLLTQISSCVVSSCILILSTHSLSLCPLPHSLKHVTSVIQRTL